MPQSPCPYCGHIPPSPDAARCAQCGGLFEPLSLKATQLAMGPWYIRDENRPFMPGFSEAILRHQVAAGRIKADTIVRGPTTHQFWVRADQAPGLSRLLGLCHACGEKVSPKDEACATCLADLTLPTAVDRLGLSYIEPAERQQVQTQIDASRQGTAASAKPTPSKKVASTPVDPDLLEPVEPEFDTEHEGFDAPTLAGDEPAHGEFAEDLWQSDAPAATRRRKKRRGADPIVLSLAVLLLCVVGVGLFVIITGGKGDPNDVDPGDPFVQKQDGKTTKSLPDRSADEVSGIAESALAAFEKMRDAGVPEPFTAEFDKAGQLNDQAKRYADAKDYATAYDHYDRSHTLLDSLETQIARWQADQAIRDDVNARLNEVVALQSQAQAAEAQKWSAGWSKGEAALGRAKAMIQAEQYTEADEKLREAAGGYEEAIEAARQATAAIEAQKSLVQAMQNGPSEQSLREHASGQIDRLNTSRAEAARKFENGQYAEAQAAYQDALSAYGQAMQQVELARYRKVYAYQAGYAAAGALIGITTGDGLSAEVIRTLDEAFDKLSLSDNPAEALRAGDEADYAAAADQLVTRARQRIADTHGETARASYHAGFQTRIIEHTLKTPALTADQQKRIHQCLNVLQDQAAEGGWDVVKLRDVVEAVRNANRLAKIGESPEKVRAAFVVLLKPMQGRESAARLMDPALSPSSPNDPELFPGLGSTGP